MRHFALALRFVRRGKLLGYIPVLYVENPNEKATVKFIGAHSIGAHTEPSRKILCGEKGDANALALKFTNCYNGMTGSHKVRYVDSLQKIPTAIKEFLLAESKSW